MDEHEDRTCLFCWVRDEGPDRCPGHRTAEREMVVEHLLQIPVPRRRARA